MPAPLARPWYASFVPGKKAAFFGGLSTAALTAYLLNLKDSIAFLEEDIVMARMQYLALRRKKRENKRQDVDLALLGLSLARYRKELKRLRQYQRYTIYALMVTGGLTLVGGYNWWQKPSKPSSGGGGGSGGGKGGSWSWLPQSREVDASMVDPLSTHDVLREREKKFEEAKQALALAFRQQACVQESESVPSYDDLVSKPALAAVWEQRLKNVNLATQDFFGMTEQSLQYEVRKRLISKQFNDVIGALRTKFPGKTISADRQRNIREKITSRLADNVLKQGDIDCYKGEILLGAYRSKISQLAQTGRDTRRYVSLKEWKVIPNPGAGHCFFYSILPAVREASSSKHLEMKDVRKVVAAHNRDKAQADYSFARELIRPATHQGGRTVHARGDINVAFKQAQGLLSSGEKLNDDQISYVTYDLNVARRHGNTTKDAEMAGLEQQSPLSNEQKSALAQAFADAYCKEFSTRGWGGQHEANAASQVYKMPVRIIRTTQQASSGGENVYPAKNVYLYGSQQPGQGVTVVYNGGHYEELRAPTPEPSTPTS